LTLILAILALLVPVAVWMAPILAAAFVVLVVTAIVEAVMLRRTSVTLERKPRVALPLDEADVASIRITTTATRPLRLVVRQRWPSIVTPRSQTVHAICRPREVLQVDLAVRGIARGMGVVETAYAAMTGFGLSERVMPHLRDLTIPPFGERRCPKCGLPMLLSVIEPGDNGHEDLRTFECQECYYAETVAVHFS